LEMYGFRGLIKTAAAFAKTNNGSQFR
jgi:hypothetical protein